ncbi:ABC transporter substrate-binding protein [Clostridium sp.]|uniref:ABC transporter substrate-binding protein n=1 Tax=Clostridium sp. TaxID=1506 RepID=UPI00262BA27C|nr:ABC transporter substrate-binding protein [uncultured Clostridium sp.]
MFKKKSIISLVLAALICIVFSFCSNKVTDNTIITTKKETTTASYPLKIVDSYNRTVTIESEPKRIITIAPNIAEGIYALGKDRNLVGRSDYDNYPVDALKVASVGSLLHPNIEKIVGLKPDVVIASTHFDKDVIKKL